MPKMIKHVKFNVTAPGRGNFEKTFMGFPSAFENGKEVFFSEIYCNIPITIPEPQSEFSESLLKFKLVAEICLNENSNS